MFVDSGGCFSDLGNVAAIGHRLLKKEVLLECFNKAYSIGLKKYGPFSVVVALANFEDNALVHSNMTTLGSTYETKLFTKYSRETYSPWVKEAILERIVEEGQNSGDERNKKLRLPVWRREQFRLAESIIGFRLQDAAREISKYKGIIEPTGLPYQAGVAAAI